MRSDERVFRAGLRLPAVPPWAIAATLFGAHAALRLARLRRPQFIPLSLLLLWPAPWLLSDREGRAALGFRRPAARRLFLAAILGLVALLTCAFAAWAAFGSSDANWFSEHAQALARSAKGVPPQLSSTHVFWLLTIPAVLLSPFSEEFLFRGYLLRTFTPVCGPRGALILQAGAFSLVHLSHYGVRPFNPELIPLWLASMFGVAVLLGWLVMRSESIWYAVVAHIVFNLSMNAVTFTAFSEIIRRPSVLSSVH